MLEMPEIHHVEAKVRETPKIEEKVPKQPVLPPNNTQFSTDPEETDLPVECFCVKYLREKLGVPIYGNANTIKPNSRPVIGGVILFYSQINGQEVGHAAQIVSFEKEGYLIREANNIPCKAGTRVVSYDNKNIRGFWSSQ